MEIFISWAGDRSKAAATALREWLPLMLQLTRPWISLEMEKGVRWSTEVAGKLESCKIGIVCLTPFSLKSDWVLFEAGALSKVVGHSHLCPLLFDLKPSEVKGPLSQFQLTDSAKKEDMRTLIGTINNLLGDSALPTLGLNRVFDKWWPELEASFKSLPDDHQPTEVKRESEDVLEEILGAVRGIARRESNAGARVEQLIRSVPATISISDDERSALFSRRIRQELSRLAPGFVLSSFGYYPEGNKYLLKLEHEGAVYTLYLPNATTYSQLRAALIKQLGELPLVLVVSRTDDSGPEDPGPPPGMADS